ncbi:DUF4386 domain-containing protein [Salipiger thiooxidans]|uniref:DUF4386 domain-containing protein n=1 Tax=Salipiger thiooxidans TaxID=282683 RepID=UPI001A8D1705|nr:DUF4386 domain-containing protein [Salipiger thiooxidans]MBN8186882.1 DUF4386 domain-containing protein [Salipiger thiooxidans]
MFDARPVSPARSRPFGAARAAGVLYLAIIALGLTSELALRGALVVPGNAAETAARILAAPGLLRASLAADTVMALADVALAVLLYQLLRPVSAPVALAAMVFRLVQAGLIAASLLFQAGALLALEMQGEAGAATAQLAMALQAHGYDLGLVFFGVTCLLTGWLLARAGARPALLGWLIAASGLVYIAGSALRFLAPELGAAFEPAYLLPMLAESGFCLWLLLRAPGLLAR